MVIANKSAKAKLGEPQGSAVFGVVAQFASVGVLGALFVSGLGWAMTAHVMATLCGLMLFIVAMGVAGLGLRASYPHPAIGLCNIATIFRLVLASVLLAVLLGSGAPAWGVFGVAVVAFAMDGLDGWLARLQGYASSFGARFDMEVDSVLALILAALAWQSGVVGGYVIILGLPRYVFCLAQFRYPWLNGDLPERFSRKVVCVLQISALILVLFPLVTPVLASVVAAIATAALVWSFGLDVRVLWRARP